LNLRIQVTLAFMMNTVLASDLEEHSGVAHKVACGFILIPSRFRQNQKLCIFNLVHAYVAQRKLWMFFAGKPPPPRPRYVCSESSSKPQDHQFAVTYSVTFALGLLLFGGLIAGGNMATSHATSVRCAHTFRSLLDPRGTSFNRKQVRNPIMRDGAHILFFLLLSIPSAHS
jgi:hypothetical protein